MRILKEWLSNGGLSGRLYAVKDETEFRGYSVWLDYNGCKRTVRVPTDSPYRELVLHLRLNDVSVRYIKYIEKHLSELRNVKGLEV